jgi:hypothetical protein
VYRARPAGRLGPALPRRLAGSGRARCDSPPRGVKLPRRRAASSCPGIRVRALRPVRLRRPCVRRALVRGAASSASGTLVVRFPRIHYALSLSRRRRHRRRASETARGVSATPRVACLRRGGAVRIRSAAGASMTASAAPLSTKTAQRQHEEHKDSTKPVCSRRPLSSFKPHVHVAKR